MQTHPKWEYEILNTTIKWLLLYTKCIKTFIYKKKKKPKSLYSEIFLKIYEACNHLTSSSTGSGEN